jgi:hypothetical protein
VTHLHVTITITDDADNTLEVRQAIPDSPYALEVLASETYGRWHDPQPA